MINDLDVALQSTRGQQALGFTGSFGASGHGGPRRGVKVLPSVRVALRDPADLTINDVDDLAASRRRDAPETGARALGVDGRGQTRSTTLALCRLNLSRTRHKAPT